MNKQEEIREGIKTLIAIEWDAGHENFDGNRLLKYILQYLHSLGVVIKVDRKLPKHIKTWTVRYPDETDNSAPEFEDAYRPVTLEDMLKAGVLVATEPLIRDNNFTMDGLSKAC